MTALTPLFSKEGLGGDLSSFRLQLYIIESPSLNRLNPPQSHFFLEGGFLKPNPILTGFINENPTKITKKIQLRILSAQN